MIKSFLKRTSRRFNLNKEDGFHIYYAMGVARGDQYASFQSLGSSIKQGLDFIYENRARFVGHTFYAHNGGSGARGQAATSLSPPEPTGGKVFARLFVMHASAPGNCLYHTTKDCINKAQILPNIF